MVTPETYRGYDKDNNCIVTVTAVDANTYINPEEVKTAVDNLKKTVKAEMKRLAKALRNVGDEEGSTPSLIVQGTKMDKIIDSFADSLSKDVASYINGKIDELNMYSEAVNAHDKLQNSANNNAYNQARSNADVVVVR